jgi:hypothetical protein
MPASSHEHLSDRELLLAAEQAGTFDFLDSPEEDVYGDLREDHG